ncbi:MAG TPA: hypothetical protein VFT27_13655 [Actinomycetota bacterium]|nr:hypothetical protein [Actinomycetota bacterium]
MQPSETNGPTPVGGILALAGGGLLVVGSFLDWAKVSGSGINVTGSGTEGTDGWITLVAGAVALVVGLTMLRVAGKRALAILAIVAGLVGGGVGLYDALTAKDSVLDSAAEELTSQFGGSTEQMRALLDAAIDAGELSITVAIGLYLVIAGGAIAIAGGAIALVRGSAAAPMPVASEAYAEPMQPATADTWATAPAPTSGSPEEVPESPSPPATEGRPPPATAEPPPPPPPMPSAPEGSPPTAPAEQPPSPWATPAEDDGGTGPDEEP